jgi:dihydrofolate synthase/folylpolyglutamate synthase
LEAETIVRAIAAERGSGVISVRQEFGEELARYPKTNLEGSYQRWNAATATLVARALPARWKLSGEVITRGLQDVDWPGRWQRTTLGSRRLILDASHNPEGATVLDANLRALVQGEHAAPAVIVGVLGAVRARPLMEVIARYAGAIYLVVPNQARACSHEELAALIPATFKGRVVRSTIPELFPSTESCTAGRGGDTVLVTGSIYLVGEVMARLEPERGPNEAKLQDF